MLKKKCKKYVASLHPIKKSQSKGSLVFAFVQFFEEAQSTESYLKNLQDSIRKKYVCDKNMSLQVLLEQIKELEVLLSLSFVMPKHLGLSP